MVAAMTAVAKRIALHRPIHTGTTFSLSRHFRLEHLIAPRDATWCHAKCDADLDGCEGRQRAGTDAQHG
jgi:hypothetical protein